MAKRDYGSEAMVVLAQRTALKVGCQALRWWQDRSDPRRLYIEATLTGLSRQAFPVMLESLLPEQQEEYSHIGRQVVQLAFPQAAAAMPIAAKKPLERGGFSHTDTH